MTTKNTGRKQGKDDTVREARKHQGNIAKEEEEKVTTEKKLETKKMKQKKGISKRANQTYSVVASIS
jgi:hypothetical protein